MLFHTFMSVCKLWNSATSDASFSIVYLFAKGSLLQTDCEAYCSTKIIWLRNLKCGLPVAWFFFFFNCFPFFNHLSTSKGYEYKQKCFNALMLNMPCTKMHHFFSWLWNDISKTCWSYRWRQHGHSGEQRGQMALSLLFLRAPFPIHTPLCCIASHRRTKPRLQWSRTSAAQSRAQPGRPHGAVSAVSLHRALTAQTAEWHLSVMSMSGMYFWSWSLLSTLLIRQSCSMTWNMSVKRVSWSSNVQSHKGKLLSWAGGEVMLYGYSSALKCIRFVHLPIITYLLLWH